MKVNNFFDLVKDNFFNVFTSSNKRINYDLLQIFNKKMSLETISVKREDIIGWILDYTDSFEVKLTSDDDFEEISDKREFASRKLRYFVDTGWLLQDTDGMQLTYQLDEFGIVILESMENAVLKDRESIEYTGYVYNIYKSLEKFEYDHAVDIVEQAYKNSNSLSNSLKGLTSNIKKYLNRLIKDVNANAKEILSVALNDYQNKVVLKAFKNFREKDNPSKYKVEIINTIKTLLEPVNLKRMVDNYLLVKENNESSPLKRIEAEEFFTIRLNHIRNQFEDIEEYINKLNSKNTQYIKTAEARVNFLLNEETNVEGKIINTLKNISKVDDYFFEEAFFRIFSGLNLDEKSLYKPRIITELPVSEVNEIELEDFDNEAIERAAKRLFEENKYCVKSVNDFIMEKLGDKVCLKASEIEVNNFEDLMKVFLATLYSQNEVVEYKLQLTQNKYRALNYEVLDYFIERKEK